MAGRSSPCPWPDYCDGPVMARHLIFLEYDGTSFRGFQYQPGERTVQGEVEGCLAKLVGTRVPVTGAGRTDAGVHALAMPAHLDLENGDRMLSALARVLPVDVALKSHRRVPDGFNARFHAVRRVYRYRIGKTRSPLKARTEYQPGILLDTGAMNKAAELCVGRADWRGFAKTGGGNATWEMNVSGARVEEDSEGWTMWITSDRFLRGVVRIWAGTLLRIGMGRLSPCAVRAILEGGGRAGPSLPAMGLTLVEVRYDGIP